MKLSSNSDNTRENTWWRLTNFELLALFTFLRAMLES